MDVGTQVRRIVTVEAVITRADGTVEDLGVVASSEDGTAEWMGE